MPSPFLVSALVSFLQPCYEIQSGIYTVLTEAMIKLPAPSVDAFTLCAPRAELSFTPFQA